jgi:hypothetical protein
MIRNPCPAKCRGWIFRGVSRSSDQRFPLRAGGAPLPGDPERMNHGCERRKPLYGFRSCVRPLPFGERVSERSNILGAKLLMRLRYAMFAKMFVSTFGQRTLAVLLEAQNVRFWTPFSAPLDGILISAGCGSAGPCRTASVLLGVVQGASGFANHTY